MTGLREELDAVLRTVNPGGAPVEAAMRQGRRLRLRRRMVMAASVATVAVAVVAGYPALSQKQATPAPSSAPQHPYITVTPGPGSTSGVIAVGTIKGTRWTVSLSNSFAGGCLSGTIGTDVVSGDCYRSGMLVPPGSGNPLGLQGVSDPDYTVAAGAVEANVQYVVLTLTDSQQLKLIPVAYAGHRYIAYAAPYDMRVTMATAYLSNGQELTAIPFDPPGFAVPEFVRWQGPGQHPVPLVTEVIGSGRTDGQHWSVTASIGPWGTCLQGTAAGIPQATDVPCSPSTQLTSTQMAMGGVGPANDLQLIVGSAAPTVTEVKVTLTDGTSVRVPVKAAGGEKFWALALGPLQSLRNWAAYDAAGKQVASGSGTG